MVRWGYDDVRGVIIGGDYIEFQVFYDDRPQSEKFYAETEEEAKAQAEAHVAKLKAEYKGYPCCLYPDDSKWEMRIYDN